MTLYIQLVIEDVEADADVHKIARIVCEQVQAQQPYHVITVGEVEVQ